MKTKFTRKAGTIALLAGSILLLAAGCTNPSANNGSNPDNSLTSQTTNQQTSANTIYPSPNSFVNDSELRFTGTIKATKNELPFDGDLSIQVDDKWVAIDGGMIMNLPKGTVSGLDLVNLNNSIGTKVEVFAAQTSPENKVYFSIVGDTKYYVRAIK